ncbi:ribonuclease M5 [Paenactinomyces guangxiensis]|uniref:Ribonuclease M5 n=1 Tax=Paenactinomyces guangxiensis TaxID=1490290 RepID=A0A7W1WTK0_9BACL|nr:ribonuclease M5 [Paenactinomyces guangxiensis]MBA4495831.1 ribonuclease M5 [Paenactinomyces guangxiensis]MBH8592921.1 ribonuclease M5 [Paenactinomyces guangxiensis]
MKEIIVVEGRNDTVAIRRAVQADTIETRGSAIGPHILAEIRRAQEKRGVIVFTDPDHAGERIRRIISEHVPGVKHAFLPQKKAKGKHKIGIEHAAPEAIAEALQSVRSEGEDSAGESPISWEDYLNFGFAGDSHSRLFRQQVADALGIGYGNAKQFFRRLHVLRINKEELYQAMDQVRKDALNE